MGEKGAAMGGKGAVTEEKGADAEQESAVSSQRASSWAGKKLKIRSVPIGMCQVPAYRFSIGTVIFPRSKHFDWGLSHSDRTSCRSDVISEKAKNIGLCQLARAKCHRSILNWHRHLPGVEAHRLKIPPF